MRVWHEVRVRELVAPDRWVKKSKFYRVHKPGDAVKKYEKRSKVSHTIMWCEKDRRHSPERPSYQIPRILADVRNEQKLLGSTALDTESAEQRLREKERVIKRRSYEQREKDAAH